MSRQIIDIGINPNDGTGDNLREAGGIVNYNFYEIYEYLGAGSSTTLSVPRWITNSYGISTTFSVGIGTTRPRFSLEVGSVGASGTSLYVNGNIRSTGIISSTNLVSGNLFVSAGATAQFFSGSGIGLTGIPAGQLTGQLPAIDGSLLTNLSAVTASNVFWIENASGIHTVSNVGIGTTLPTSLLSVDGNAVFSGIITASSANFSGIVTSSGAVVSGIISATSIETLSEVNVSKIETAYKLGILSPSVGIGTTNPFYELDVNGDVRVGIDTSSGIILKSPNGIEYRITVSDNGTLNTTLLS